MSAAEFTYWMAFERLEPFGALVDDYRAGAIASTVFNANRGPKSKYLVPSDFMPALSAALHGEPEPEKPQPKLTPQQEAAFLDAAFGF